MMGDDGQRSSFHGKYEEMKQKMDELQYKRRMARRKLSRRFVKGTIFGLTVALGAYMGNLAYNDLLTSQDVLDSDAGTAVESSESVSSSAPEVRRDFGSIDELVADIEDINQGPFDDVMLSLYAGGTDFTRRRLDGVDHFAMMRIDEFANDYSFIVRRVRMHSFYYMSYQGPRRAKAFRFLGDDVEDFKFRAIHQDGDDNLAFGPAPDQSSTSYADAVYISTQGELEDSELHNEMLRLESNNLSNDGFYQRLLNAQREGMTLEYVHLDDGASVLFAFEEGIDPWESWGYFPDAGSFFVYGDHDE